MIKETLREAGPFKIQEHDLPNKYYCHTQEGQIFAWMHVQYIKDIAYIHFYVEGFSHNILREMRKDLTFIKKTFANDGIKRIMGVHEREGSEKWVKFLRLVGFKKVRSHGQYKLTEMEV
jgi:hypothetical protein